MKAIFAILLTGALASCGPATFAEEGGPPGNNASPELSVLPAAAKKGELFTFYEARGKSRWKRNWTSKLDLTGVSWNDARTATLISRSHVVMAAHFIRPGSTPVMFHDKSGKPHERFIAAVRSLKGTGDIAVAKLNLPLPPEVKHYRFASESEARPGRPVIVTDQTRAVSVHQIDAVFGRGIRFKYHPDLDPVYRRRLIVGDSGNPSFLLVNGELVLLETHTTGGPGAGPFYGSPEVQAAIRAAMAEMGD